ncbi:hypothetical protein TPA0909_00880 [Streptomyces albus]|nr:hypothetical protein TPA0909_00880 [Streptomyces albus]
MAARAAAPAPGAVHEKRSMRVSGGLVTWRSQGMREPSVRRMRAARSATTLLSAVRRSEPMLTSPGALRSPLPSIGRGRTVISVVAL